MSYHTSMSPQQCQEANAIDTLRTKCGLCAEKKCRKLKMGAVDYSLEMARHVKQIAFWDIAISRRYPEAGRSRRKKRSKRHSTSFAPSRPAPQISSRLWQRKKKAANVKISTRHMSPLDMQEERWKAKKDYKEAKKNSSELRLQFLETLDPKHAPI